MTPPLQGLYTIIDSRATPEMLPYTTSLLEGGCRILQVRCKGWSHDDIASISREIVKKARPYNAIVIINDHPTIAKSVGAHGVHLGQEDGAVADARNILGPHCIIGRSTNRLEQVSPACKEADYIAFGPIWHTTNIGVEKQLNGVDRLRKARALAQHTPLFAIGGITIDRVPQLQSAGVDGWAVIGALAEAVDPMDATRTFMQLMS